MDETGAVVMGRNLFDVIDGPLGWNDEMGYGAEHAGRPPFFVVTHAAPEQVRLGLDFTFVTDGVAAAVDPARAEAGDKDVVVMGGGDVVRQCVDGGLGRRAADPPLADRAGRRDAAVQGEPPARAGPATVRVSTHATHLTYDVG